MDQLDIERMRDDYRTVAADRKAAGLWTDADEQEAGATIAVAMSGDDADLKAQWAAWLAAEAEEIRRERSMRPPAVDPANLSRQARNRLGMVGG